MSLRSLFGVRTPTILQMENSECGAACLAMVLAAYGRWETLDTVRDRFGTAAVTRGVLVGRAPDLEFPLLPDV